MFMSRFMEGSPSLSYEKSVSQYTNQDFKQALKHSLVFYFTFTILLYILLIGLDTVGFLSDDVGSFDYELYLIGLMICGCFVLCLFRTRSIRLESVGVNRYNLKRVLIFCVVTVLAVVVLDIVSGVFGSLSFVAIIIIFLFAWIEDMYFVGYLQTRLRGGINRRWLTLIVGASIFTLFHTSSLVASGFHILHISLFFLSYYVYATLYRRFNSIWPCTLVHGLSNFLRFSGFGLVSLGLFALALVVSYVLKGVWNGE